MIKIGVIADTHIPTRCRAIPDEILKQFKGVDLILHLGDFIDLAVLNDLKKLAPVKAVCGNMDPAAIKKKCPRKLIVKVGKFKIGLIHDLGSVSTRLERAREEFNKSKINAVVFAHSHSPVNEKKGGILFFNPGSPTDTIFAPYKSFGFLTLTDKIEGKIIKLKD